MENFSLDFKPMFFILDIDNKRIMAVREYDWHPGRDYFYAFKGTYILWDEQDMGWRKWPAYMNKQELAEFPTQYDMTKDEDFALEWILDDVKYPRVTQHERAENFPQ